MKRLLLLIALFTLLGGANSVKAEPVKLYSTEFTDKNGGKCSWDSENNIYSWQETSNNTICMISFDAGVLSAYTKLHVKWSGLTEGAQMRVMLPRASEDGGGNFQKILTDTSGDIYLDLLSDFTHQWGGAKPTAEILSRVTQIRIGGNSAPTSEELIADPSASHSMTIKPSDIYLEGPTYEVYSLGSAITFAQALETSDPFVLVQNGKVLCGPLSLSDNSLTFKDVAEIKDYSWTIKFEEDASNKGSYFMELRNSNDESKGYINASVWSHTYLSNIDKSGTKGEVQDGALWTIASAGDGKYTIKNLGVSEGNYNDKPGGNEGDRAEAGQGFLAITTSGYWANHVTHYNTSGMWEFRKLTTTSLPAYDPVYYGWDDMTFTSHADVTKDDETHLVVDKRGYAPYWAETASKKFDTPFDATNYRYLVFFAKRNVTKYGNGNNETGGTLFIKDNSGVSFRQGDYTSYDEKNYPNVPSGTLWMNRWNGQRAMALDLQWLAKTDKFGDGSDCKVLDITKITEIGVAGTFTIGGFFFTNTLPAYSAGDYKRNFDSFDKFGTICLPYSAVCCGAQLYEIEGLGTNSITLVGYEGIMEAGKPYLYKTLEAKKGDYNNEAADFYDETDVYFFKAGYKKVDSPVENNGLIGTFSDITAPDGTDYLILSNNTLYNTDGAIGDDAITIGANKAYIDKSKIVSSGSARGIKLFFGDAEVTGVKEIVSAQRKDGKFYDMMGREVTRPVKGHIYIYNGIKIAFK